MSSKSLMPVKVSGTQELYGLLARAAAAGLPVDQAPEGTVAKSWYRMTNMVTGDGDAKKNVAEILIYDRIGMWGIEARQFVEDLEALSPVDEVLVRIHSHGGDASDSVAIYNALRRVEVPVRVRIEGIAASGASIIAMAGRTIEAEESAILMTHEASSLAIGTAEDLRAVADVVDKVSGQLAAIYAKRAGGTVDQWRERMRAESWYTGAEAKAVGLVDTVIEDPATPDDQDDEDPAADVDGLERAAILSTTLLLVKALTENDTRDTVDENKADEPADETDARSNVEANTDDSLSAAADMARMQADIYTYLSL